jgi:nitrate/nitrite-specific signal transduction histidine kinase
MTTAWRRTFTALHRRPNGLRHGKPKFIVINLFTQTDRVVLGVKDDGIGFPTKQRKHNGMGLRVMRYRAGMVGGSIVVQREPGGGTSVVCSLRAEKLPVAREQKAEKRRHERDEQPLG